MNLTDILAISGEPGLFRFVAQGRNSIIVENLETGKKTNVHGSSKVNSLVDIAIFTESEDIPLSSVFDRIFEKESGNPAPDPKSAPDKLKDYFESVLPEYNRERVFVSDIKKVLAWYNKLQELKMLIKDEPVEKSEEVTDLQKETVNKED